MKKCVKKHKKQVILGVICLIVLLILLMVKLFVLPSFNGNKYGDRLKDEKKYKISNETISKIKDKAKDTDGVTSIDYHKEGRILNFTIIVGNDFGVNQAKDFVNGFIGEIGEKNLKYYDVQIFIDSEEKNDQYPIIGYKNKNSDAIDYGTAGGNGA